MEYLFALVLNLLTPAYAVLARLHRSLRVRRGRPPVRTRFIPTTWQVPHGILALLPVDCDFEGDMSFTAPPSWIRFGTFLTDTLFAFEVENTSDDDFARRFTIREMFVSITRATPLGADEESGRVRSLRRWPGPAIGPLDNFYIDDPAQTAPRIVHVRELPEGPAPLLAASVSTPVPPHGCYHVAAGNCVKFVMRFEFDAPGEYQVAIRLEISESGRESLHSVIENLRLAQIPDVTELAVIDTDLDSLADLAQDLASARRIVADHLPAYCPVTDTWHPVEFVPYLPFDYPTPTPHIREP